VTLVTIARWFRVIAALSVVMRLRLLTALVLLVCAAPTAASSTTDTLEFQHALAGDVGMVDAPWVGTHNSFNSIAEVGPALSSLDANQRLTLVDQLDLGVRSLELDLHQWLGRPTVCHAQSQHEGCTVEKPLAQVLPPVVDWLHAHPSEVVLLYLENKLDGSDMAPDLLRSSLGPLLYEPRGDGCTQLPGTLTRDDVRAAGAQVVIVSTCGTSAWNGVAHAWDEHAEERPKGVTSCEKDFTRADYDTRLVRYYEDSTYLTNTASVVGAATKDDGLTPETTALLSACGVDLFGFDQLVAGDPRLDALAWSWADGVPTTGPRCAVSGPDGWTAGACDKQRPRACRTIDGRWLVVRSCRRVGGTFAVPRTARENALLRAAADDRKVLLGLKRTAAGWAAIDARA
jgi:hypothetical protein